MREQAKNSRKKRLLIIEDEALLLGILSDAFTSEGFEVLTARNGRDGLALAFRERPDMIILDILVPEMDGLAVLRHLRADKYKWGKFVPVIILSDVSNKEAIKHSMEEHAEDYLVKADWSLSALVRKVKEKLGSHKERKRGTIKVKR